jgi:hypothetical protein
LRTICGNGRILRILRIQPLIMLVGIEALGWGVKGGDINSWQADRGDGRNCGRSLDLRGFEHVGAVNDTQGAMKC